MAAVMSSCGLYRYRLERDAGLLGTPSGPTAAIIMVNPSTADADADDATIRKLRGFTARNGFGRFVVGNLFACPIGRRTDGALLVELPNEVVSGGPQFGAGRVWVPEGSVVLAADKGATDAS